jgi:hypothetical protein
MGWSGRAPAPPAIEAGKGRQRQGARHVLESQQSAGRVPSTKILRPSSVIARLRHSGPFHYRPRERPAPEFLSFTVAFPRPVPEAQTKSC